MTTHNYGLPVFSGYTSKDFHDAAVNQSLDALKDMIDALTGGVLVVGEWDPTSGAFPTARPDASPVQAGDAWVVVDAGTVDSIGFAKADRLIALTDAPGTSYAGAWVRAPYSDLLEGFARRPFRTVLDLLADTGAARGVGEVWHAEGFRYLEAAAGASDHDLTTAGGVKLYIQREPGGFVSPAQWGANLFDDAGDDTAAFASACAWCNSYRF